MSNVAAFREKWSLDPAVVFLNHGSFGACPRAVLDEQARLRAQMERQPVRFFMRELPPMLAAARAALGAFVGANPDDLAFVPNATAGVNTVLRSLSLAPGDELVVTSHEYRACHNALHVHATRAGAKVVVAEVPFPLTGDDDVVDAVLRVVGPQTKLILIDHVTSQTGLIFPVQRVVDEARARGVDVLVDGAHAPAMLPLDLDALGAAYYTGNLHKWLCAPKGAAFLHVRADRQAGVRPLSISHGAAAPLEGSTRFRLEMDWTGTDDPTAYLCVPKAIETMGAMVPGGFAEVRERNRALVLHARRRLADVLGVALPAPDSMLGSLASLALPDGTDGSISPFRADPLQDRLFFEHQIEVPVMPWPAPPKRLLRVSAQLYNDVSDYERLVEALALVLST